MYFQRRKNAIQVFAVRGYDPQKKRSVIRYLGSIFLDPPRPDPRLLINVTNEEKKQLKAFLAKLLREQAAVSEEEAQKRLVSSVLDACDAVTCFASTDFCLSASSIQEIDQALRQMRVAFSRIRKRRKTAPEPPRLLLESYVHDGP